MEEREKFLDRIKVDPNSPDYPEQLLEMNEARKQQTTISATTKKKPVKPVKPEDKTYDKPFGLEDMLLNMEENDYFVKKGYSVGKDDDYYFTK